MNVTITARSPEITNAMKEYAEKKVTKVLKFSLHILTVHVYLDVHKYRYYAEMSVHADHIKLTGKEESDDMTKSIDDVIDKIEKQLKKYKEKKKDHKRCSVSQTEDQARQVELQEEEE